MLGENAANRKDAHREHCHHIRIHSGSLVQNPEEDCHGEGHIDHDGAPVLFGLALDVEFDGLGLEREELDEHEPSYEEKNDRQRDHEGHPLTEADIDSDFSHVLESDGIRRGTDRGSHATDVGCDRNRKGKRYLSLAVSRQSL